MATGKLKWFNPNKGYGFITPDDGSNDVFLHISALEESNIETLDENEELSYDIGDHNGKTKATNVKKLQG